MKTLPTLLAVIAAFASMTAAADTSTRKLTVDGIERSWILHLPPGHEVTIGKRWPVVLVFHGGGGNARSIMMMSGMNNKADAAGFIAVYPNGTGRAENRFTFNGGLCCAYAKENDVDDVAFVAAILDELDAAFGADPSRVYATGLSNGGILSHYIAANLAGRITAIAPVAGTIGIDAPEPARPVPVMHIHGTDDQALPIDGGFGRSRRTDFNSVDDTLRAWIIANDARVVPVRHHIDSDPKDGCTVDRFDYAPRSDEGAEVVFVRLNGGGHTWPDAVHSPDMLGKVCRDVNANDLMWAFFERHRIE